MIRVYARVIILYTRKRASARSIAAATWNVKDAREMKVIEYHLALGTWRRSGIDERGSGYLMNGDQGVTHTFRYTVFFISFSYSRLGRSNGASCDRPTGYRTSRVSLLLFFLYLSATADDRHDSLALGLEYDPPLVRQDSRKKYNT